MQNWKENIVAQTAYDWELFTSVPGAAGAARAMNRALVKTIAVEFKALATGRKSVHMAACDARSAFQAVQRKFSAFGAEDTEPDTHVVKLINEAMGANIGRWS